MTSDTERPSQRAARLVLALALVGLGLWTLHRFLPALVWAGILAIAIWPYYCRIRRRYPPGPHNLALPALFTGAIALLVVGPVAVAGFQAGREAVAVAAWLDEARRTGIPVPDWLAALPLAGAHAAAWWQDNLSDPDHAAALLHGVTPSHYLSAGGQVGAAVLHRATLFGFTLLTLFFLFRDGAVLAERLLVASHRAFGPGGERIGRQVVASIHGTVDGLVLVGLGEGFLLGLAYAATGVPHPALLGVLTALGGMIPFGAPVVFGIAALLLLVKGSMAGAIVIVALGMAVTFIADHFIRPALIGGATRLPFLWVLLGILGGLEVWGLLGLFLGPAIMAALILLWREWTAGPGEDGLPGTAEGLNLAPATPTESDRA